ncbi:hypothetical protein QBC38DRAFT_493584 [Podospora fimiseda]|uniref:Uncharacterized protein n=1 Tax=Podospora fimiseda TaxID=252190 RepID=A0AAN7BE90_9PEZI|nr:hypothetical protein QBC38DRAFT_493584 [Podospora fimiseda]
MSFSPSFNSLYADGQRTIPSNVILDQNLWVIGNNISSFRTQQIQCGYPISGGYGPTARYIYYFLSILSVVAHKQSWVVSAALASVMVYSSTAAIHAFVITRIRTLLQPRAIVAWKYEVVLVQGHSADGYWEPAYQDGPVWYPILPMAWDADVDAVLAIVATAFLLLLPMQIWSKTLRYAPTEKRRIVLVWALLVFAGLICALVNFAYVWLWAFPQLRFCPVDKEDVLPLTGPGLDDNVEPWDGSDEYRWNRTLTDYFVYGNRSGPVATECFYPCFGTSWPLRQKSDILVLEGDTGVVSDSSSSIGIWFLFTGYLVVGIFTISSLTVAFLVSFSFIPSSWRPLDIPASTRGILSLWSNCPGNNARDTEMRMWDKLWRTAVRLWILGNVFVARYLAPIVTVGFIVSMEWIMWTADPGVESFRHVGQWSVLVGALLVLLVATIPTAVSRLFETRLVGFCVKFILGKVPWLRRYLTRRKFRTPVPQVTQRRRSV